MTSLPTGITYGTVKGRFVEAILDGPDEDDNPDARPIVGTVTLTPEAKHILAATNVPPTTVMATALKIPLDSSGSFETKVVATDNTALNPTEWTYRVTFSFDRGITYAPFNIEVPAGQITDLTVTAPSPVSPGVVTVVREEDRVAAEAAALRAEDAARRAEEAANGGGGGPGTPGKSAYEVAVDEGFVGDVVAWLASLVGPPGATTIEGIEGLREELDGKAASTAVEPKRDPGSSSGERAVGYANGEPTVFTVHTSPNTSTIAKRGAAGTLMVGNPTAETHAANKRYVDEAIAGVSAGAGTPGKSAYEIAVENGFVGTEAEWLASLEGTDGATTIEGIEGLRAELDLRVTTKTGASTLAGVAGWTGGAGQDGVPRPRKAWDVTTSALAGSLVERGTSGRIKAGEPAADDDVTTKKYVDDAIAGVSGGTAPVTKVNDQTGDVVLDASDVGAIPDTYAAPDGETRVPYYSANTGQQAHIIMTVNPDSGTLVKRQASGHVLVPSEPTFETHATSKTYVDGKTTIDGIEGLRAELNDLRAMIEALGMPVVKVTAAEYAALDPVPQGVLYAVVG